MTTLSKFILLAQVINNPEEPVFPVQNYEGSIMKMFMTLLALIVLLIITALLLKRFLRFRMQASSVGQSIQIKEKRILSPKTILYLVEVEGQEFLVSESQVQIQKIDTLKEPVKTNSNQ
ncbi:MAG: flagellar biosynthetic protein FliO [Chlamydiota bacterium]|jgi:flagellar protein FliO/FliZ